MADSKVYVEIVNFATKDLYDDKLKSRFATLATTTAEKAATSAGFTLDKPKEKTVKGWSINGSVASVGPDKSGKKFVAQVSAGIFNWPKKTLRAMPSGEAGFAIEPGEKVSPGDADQLVKTATVEAMKTALNYMKSNKPE